MESRTKTPHRCPASAVVGSGRAFGQLAVTSRSIAFEPRGFLNTVMAGGAVGRIVHTGRTVVLVHARMRAGHANTTLHLVGDPQVGYGVEARIGLSGRNRAAVVRALGAAGYGVERHTTWFSVSPAACGS
jgi:hypothetical protein